MPAITLEWGGDGGQLVCLIGEPRLTPAAKAGIYELLGKDVNISDAEFARWADPIAASGQRQDHGTTWTSNEPDPSGVDPPQGDPYRRAAESGDKSLVKLSGVVIIRQSPGNAKGIVFETLEDETGTVNLVILPDVSDRCPSAAHRTSIVQANGNAERQSEVLHVIAMRLHDLSGLVAKCALRSRVFL